MPIDQYFVWAQQAVLNKHKRSRESDDRCVFRLKFELNTLRKQQFKYMCKTTKAQWDREEKERQSLSTELDSRGNSRWTNGALCLQGLQ